MTADRRVAGLVVGTPDDPQAHPLHLEWLDDVDADLVALDTDLLPGTSGDSFVNDLLAGWRRQLAPDIGLSAYDFVVVEAPAALYAFPWLDTGDASVVFLHTSWRLDGTTAHSFSEFPAPLRPVAAVERRVDSMLLRALVGRYVDRVVTVSDLFARRLRERGVDCPIDIYRPYVRAERADRLRTVDPAYGDPHAILVCTWREHKGVDLLVEAWPRVREQHPDARLTLVGSGHPERYGDTPGVGVAGYVDSVVDALASASLYVHPARLDAFPVAALEALCAGLPTVLTRRTGVAEVTEGALPEWMVVDPTPTALATAMVRYFDLPPDERRELGDAARAIGEEYRGPTDRSFGDVL